MALSKKEFNKYIAILKKELKPAMGCTEPIAIAYSTAKAKKILNNVPDSINIKCSSNIIKNADGVTVPNSGKLKGIETAAILGALGGNSEKELEVLTDVTKQDVIKTKKLLNTNYCNVELLESKAKLHIKAYAYHEDEKVMVEMLNEHTNIVKIIKDDKLIFEKDAKLISEDESKKNKKYMSVKKIIEFANNVDIKEVSDIIKRQIKYNLEISNEGISNDYGLNVGSTILESKKDSIEAILKGYSAAASDARMSGSLLPVVINSGSGNQGITVSIPVIKYAEYLNIGNDKLIRSLIISNLISIYIKGKIGILSAYCGAVSAAAGSGAAFTYLSGGGYKEISDTITNTLGNTSGILCDGAKPSCAAKIASSIDSAILAHKLTMANKSFGPNEGIIKDNIEDSINVIGKIADKGMNNIDKEILKAMLNDNK